MNKFINITIIFITFVFLFSCTQKRVYKSDERTEAVKKMNEKTENIDEQNTNNVKNTENTNNTNNTDNIEIKDNDIIEFVQLQSDKDKIIMLNLLKTKDHLLKFEVQYTEKNSKLKQPVIMVGDSLKIIIGNNDNSYVLTSLKVENPVSLNAGGEKIFTTKAYYLAKEEQIRTIAKLNVPVKIDITIQRNKKAEIVSAFFSSENIASFKKFRDNYLK